MDAIVEQLLTPGSTPNVIIRIVNGSCTILIVVLGILTQSNFFEDDTSDGSISLNTHLYVMMGLAAVLVVLVNWFASELKNAKKGGAVGEKLAKDAPTKTD